jgi:adenylosuccinate synthase
MVRSSRTQFSVMMNHYTKYNIINNETHSYRILLILHCLFTNSEYPSFNLTKLDILNGLQTIKVTVAYRLPDSRVVTTLPTDLGVLDDTEPIYKLFPDWCKATLESTSYDELPAQAKAYVEFIETFTAIKINSISCGAA